MKTSKRTLVMAAFIVALLLSSCEVVGGIFKAGMGFGIFLVMAVLVLIVYLIVRFSRPK
jgi:hypothetical protein